MNKIDSLDLRKPLSLSALCIAHGKISLRTIFSKATVLAFLLLSPLFIYGQNYANSYPATDALGRKLPTSEDVGTSRKGKYVGLFYWTWHTNFAHMDVCIPSQYIAKAPEAAEDYNHPIWRKDITSHFWGEPLFGFYRDTDKWVLRKHAEMLAQAGVDVLFFDCTNGNFTWRESYRALCETFLQARRDGVPTPQIAFMLAFAPTQGAYEAIVSIYEDLYKQEEYKELFFLWEGKPLIMAYPEMLADVEGDEQRTKLNREIRNFFTFRPGQPVYNVGPQRNDHWGWLEIYPQHGFAPKPDGGFEQATVGVSQNWTAHNGLSAMNMKGAFGRSYTSRAGHATSADATAKGLNFQEQWDRALEIDPDLIFITGWNEWIMGRFDVWQNQPNAFPDQFDQEYSRDIEPMRGGHGDNYYYQMVANIRRFKGVNPSEEAASKCLGMKVDGEFDDWEQVARSYSAYKGNTLHRHSKGWGDYVYDDTSGRNDIIQAKVAHDRRNIYFYVECASDITPADESAWMRLFIDMDRKRESGWEGYDFVVNRTFGELESSLGGWHWQNQSRVKVAYAGRCMEISIPLSELGIKPDASFELEFKWVDNTQHDGDIYDFYMSGDAAPLGRFNYLYRAK